MKKYETKEYKSISKVCVELSCDLCGKVAPKANWGDHYETEEATVEIKYKSGYCFPEGGSCKDTQFDICPDCFKNKVIPWFQSQGVKPSITESDW